MPISSFYGLQTSLRGLMAQQRLLDTTSHNIANASTVGYTRQEATLAASQALQIPAGSTASGSGAHLGSGVDVQSYRRVRDSFLDLQYRGQNTNLQEWTSRANGLDSAELRGLLAEIAREHGINRALMRQELTFLAHLTRVLGQEPEPGYRPPGGTGATPPSHRALDLQA